MNNKFLEKLSVISDKFSHNNVLQGISRGVMGVLPVIIIGAFASLFLGLPIDAWKAFIASTSLDKCLNAVVCATSGMLGMYVCFSTARNYADLKGVEARIIGILACALYFMLIPFGAAEDGSTVLPFTFLGTQGMIIGIILAILTVHVYKFITDKNIVIRMPEGTPPFVSNSFTALIPAFVIAALGIMIRLIFSLTPFGSAFDFIYVVLQAPLTSVVGNNIWSIILLNVIASLIFAFGIHSGFVTGMLAPILFGLDGMNQAAYAAGEQLPNIIGMAFSYINTIAVFLPAMAIGTLLACRSERLKTVGRIGLIPAFFGISEPLVFGLPIVYNPILIIPYVFIPALNLLISYVLTNIGLVAKCTGVTVFNVPMIFTGLMNGSFTIVLLEIALLALDIVLWFPFAKMMDRRVLEEEKNA